MQGAFLPVLEDVRLRLGDDAVPSVHSVYVYGSVATGLAVPGHSDLDLSLILDRTPSSSEKAVLGPTLPQRSCHSGHPEPLRLR